MVQEQTNAVAFGGTLDPKSSNTELWNGSSWTEVNNLNTARAKNVGLGIYAALSVGGNPALAITEDGMVLVGLKLVI